MKSSFIVAMLTSLGACSGGGMSFQGTSTRQGGVAASSPETVPTSGPAAGATTLPASTGFEKPADNTVCVMGPTQEFSFSLSAAEPGNSWSDGKWIHESSVAELNLSDTLGDFLPVASYSVDDVVIMLRPEQSVGVTGGSHVGEDVTFALPDNAMLLSDPRSGTGQEGWLTPASNVFNNKTYIHKGRSFLVPKEREEMMYVRDLAAMGMPVVPYDGLSLERLRGGGFIDGNNVLRFKLVTIPHGLGSVSIEIRFSTCLKKSG